jgi:DNA-binding transcriptional MerR regulator
LHFNTKTVAKITGLSIRQIDYWDRTHFIKPSVNEASGHGSIRLYSFNDLVQLKIAKTLLDRGVSLQKIRKAIIYLKKNMPEVKKPFLEMRFLTDGETIFVITRDEKKIIDVLKSGQLVFSIALGEIVEDLKGKILTIKRERRYDVYVRGKKYDVVLREDKEGGKYLIECLSLPGCSSKGESVEEAIERIKEVIERYLRSFKSSNFSLKRRKNEKEEIFKI